jgi:hypothetical protein
MSDETGEIATIRKYLLGDLPESEAERIERSYFADGQAVDEIWAAFGELAEERLGGALSKDEAERFDRRLRSSPALREMFENEKALRDCAARIAARAPRQVESASPAAGGWWKRLLPAVFFKSPKLVAACLAALCVLGALGVWIALRAPESRIPEGSQQAKTQDQKSPDNVAQPSINPQQSPQSGRGANGKQIEEKNDDISQPGRSKSAPGVSSKTTATFLLLVAGTRSAESGPTLNIPSRTETVQLEIEPPTDDCAIFSAVLQTESGEELQRWERVRAGRSAYSSLKIARLRVRAGLLKNADYVIRLECDSTVKDPTSAAQYRFNVKKNIS